MSESTIIETINITIEDENIKGLAFYDNGEKIFLEQVYGKINEEKINLIIFPQRIEAISISFIEGFIHYIIKKYGIKCFGKNIIIIGNVKVMEKFNTIISLSVNLRSF